MAQDKVQNANMADTWNRISVTDVAKDKHRIVDVDTTMAKEKPRLLTWHWISIGLLM